MPTALRCRRSTGFRRLPRAASRLSSSVDPIIVEIVEGTDGYWDVLGSTEIDKVEVGQKAKIKVDAFADQEMAGEVEPGQAARAVHHLVAVEETDYLNATLALSKTGATFSVLAEALVDEEISSSEAEEYVTQLIESQILVPEIRLPVTGPEPVHPLVDQLYSHANTVQFAEKLDLVRNSLSEIDKAGLGVETERYRNVAQILGTLPAKVELPRELWSLQPLPLPDGEIGVLDRQLRQRRRLPAVKCGVKRRHLLDQHPQRPAVKNDVMSDK